MNGRGAPPITGTSVSAPVRWPRNSADRSGSTGTGVVTIADLLAAFDRQVAADAPFLERAVVQPGDEAELAGGGPDQGALLTDVAVGDHGVAGTHARCDEDLPQLGVGQDMTGRVGKRAKGNAVRARDVAAAGIHLALGGAVVELRVAGVDDPDARALEVGGDESRVHHHIAVCRR